jgi:hypothetical protein
MPRLFTLFTGLALATAVSYKYKDSFLKGQDDLQRGLDNVKSTLDKAPAVTRNYMSDSQKYVSDRLMPSGKRKKRDIVVAVTTDCFIVKESWNSQIINATHSMIRFDVGTKVRNFLDENVFK